MGRGTFGFGMHDLLLISDLHLGSHLKPRMRGEWVHLAEQIEDNFPRFLEHYRNHGRWQLIINGDFIDFWNIELPKLEGESAQALAVRRANAMFDAHPAVEDALSRFLTAGHGIVFVTGNHDAEFLYPSVRAAVARRLEGSDAAINATEALDDSDRDGEVRLDALPMGRVRFVRWFLREAGGAWIEHGHKFDPSNSTPSSLSPTRKGVLIQTVAEVATRSFTNLMPEIDYDAPDTFTTSDYIRWALARGIRFLLKCILLYLRMAGRVLALWVGPGRADKQAQQTHEELLASVAANAGLQMGTLMALEQMAPPPDTTTVAGLIRVTALDHVLISVLPSLAAAMLVGFGGWSWTTWLLAWLVSLIGLVLIRRGRRRRDVATDMLEVAAQVGEVTGSPLVLMGHSHHGTVQRSGSVVYANSGSWLDGSHLVVHRDPESRRLDRVELRRWRNSGVTKLRAMDVPDWSKPFESGPEEQVS